MDATAAVLNAGYMTLKSIVLHMVDINSTKEHYSSMMTSSMYYFSKTHGAISVLDPHANSIVGGNSGNFLSNIVRATAPKYGVVFISDIKRNKPTGT